MDSAIWLLTELPEWFFSSLRDPLGAGALTIIPFVGIWALVVGTILLFWGRSVRLLWFIVPIFISTVFVAAAGLFRGVFSDLVLYWFLSVFSFSYLGIVFFLVYYCRKYWLPALMFATFNLSYGVFALFVGYMSLTDNWL